MIDPKALIERLSEMADRVDPLYDDAKDAIKEAIVILTAITPVEPDEATAERVARAMKTFASQPLGNLRTLDNVLVGSLGAAWPYLARAALSALPRAEAEGWRLVPDPPNAKMIAAGATAIVQRQAGCPPDEFTDARRVYDRMIAAAPKEGS